MGIIFHKCNQIKYFFWNKVNSLFSGLLIPYHELMELLIYKNRINA